MTTHKIQWLNLPGYKGETWNPVVGCSKVSDGCKNCYAEKMANRIASMKQGKDYRMVLKNTMAERSEWNGRTIFRQEQLTKPAAWKAPRVVFVCSMGDLFHETVSFETISAIFSVMADCDRHIFIVLTKRPERMVEFVEWERRKRGWIWQPSDNVWMGVTAENQEQANIRIPYLNSIYAAVKFVSIEPMLGPVYLINLKDGFTDAFNPCDAGINWVICGGESGHHARPVHPDWVCSVRDQCQSVGVPFFFKQWGEFQPFGTTDGRQILPFDYMKYNPETRENFIRKGKHHSGNVLDGRKWEEYPEVGQ